MNRPLYLGPQAVTVFEGLANRVPGDPFPVHPCVMANAEAQAEFVALLARVRQGDADALTQLIQLYEPDVRIAARVRLGAALRPYLDLVDVVQSVHRSLISGLHKTKFDLSSPEKLIGLAV